MKLTDQQKQSITSVLNAALHNSKVVKDQLESLRNPNDKSFKDVKMGHAITEIDEAIKAIEETLEVINA